ncbi:metal-binding protein [compost metagenome]
MSMTIGELLAQLTSAIEPLEQTVDGLITGNPDSQVSGIVTAFMATQQVIEQTIAMGANLLITHEGLYYSHHEQKEALENDPVIVEKRRLIENSGIAIYRFHDYWHRQSPDGITAGLIHALEWQAHVEAQLPAAAILNLPEMTAGEAAQYVKSKLGISYVRLAGDKLTVCRRAGLLVGYRGGGNVAIPLIEDEQLDLIIAGEGPEWETPEYVRDAVHQGRHKALIMLGHAESEEPGMRYLAELLADKYPYIPVRFLADMPVYQMI